MSNKKTEELQGALLTRSVVGRYRLGYEKVALHLAGTLFEKLVDSKLDGWDPIELERTDMVTKINKIEVSKLYEDSLFTYQDVFLKYIDYNKVKNLSKSPNERVGQVRKRLHNFRMLRNKVTHGQEVPLYFKQSNVIEDWIVYLWSELAHESFSDACSKRKGGVSVIGALYEHTADYMIRAIDEVEFLDKDRAYGHDPRKIEILPKDFDNLFDLRRKLVPLKNYLSDWLPKQASFLQTDILTTIDTTSAYIWMPLVLRILATGRRRGVYDCSVSILATPLDLRIYMDFGGYTRVQRKIYYDFLDGSPEYETALSRLKGKSELDVFDIDWYSSIFNQTKLSDWITNREQSLMDAHKKIKATPRPESSPITWNRCLHGYVISKFDLAENGPIDFAMIEPKVRDIIILYQAFIAFRDRFIKEKANDKSNHEKK